MTAPGETNIVAAPPNLALWAGVLGAPALWGLQLNIGYALPPAMCHAGSRWPVHVLSGACIALALVAAVLSYRDYRRVGGSPDQTDGGPLARRRFVGALGTVVCLLFIIVMIAQALSAFFFDPCWS
jgi:hypothetical protein